MTPNIERISAFMRERHLIYLRRKAGAPGPWTDDKVLREGRFCNVYRELDTVTIWIRKNIREVFADHPDLWFMLCIARYINWPATLEHLVKAIPGGWPDEQGFRPENITTALQWLAEDGRKVYTGAYMIRAESDPNAEWFSWTKHRYIAEIVLGRLWEDREEWRAFFGGEQRTLEAAWAKFQLKRYVGWGPFMAYEVVTDLRHTRYLRNAPDIMTWANAGPGAIRGLNRLWGRELDTHPKPEQTNREMLQLLTELNNWNTLWPKQFERLEMRDIEHSLCEYDKYLRVTNGTGKMRSKYDWRKATVLE